MKIFAYWEAELGLIPEKLYAIEDYAAACDNCGNEIVHPWLIVQYIGLYQDMWGLHDLFQIMFWLVCPGCRYVIDSLKAYRQPFSVNIEEMSKDG